jgi:hypothetical protein
MGWKNPEVVAHKDNQLVSVKDLQLSPVHLPRKSKRKVKGGLVLKRFIDKY